MLLLLSYLLFPYLGLGSSENTDFPNWTTLKPEVCFGDDTYSRQNKVNPIEVFVAINIIDLFDVSEERMEFGLQTSIYEVWKDPLVKLDSLNLSNPINVPTSFSKCIWKPDMVFSNSKDSHLFDVTIPNSNIKILPEGYILRYSRYRLKISCQMHFQNYPMDTQKCRLVISLLYSNLDEATLHWFGDNGTPKYAQAFQKVKVYKGAQPLQFSMGPPKLDGGIKPRLTGNSSSLQCKFKFVRHITASIINTYIPSSLVVTLSWVSFWIEPNAVPGRVTLGVTALLTLATEIVHARSLLPPVDYMTAMDVWLFGCLLMVFSSLIEFTLAYTLSRKRDTIHPKLQSANIAPGAWTTESETKTESSRPHTSPEAKLEPPLCKDCTVKSQKLGWTLLVVVNVDNQLVEIPKGWKLQTAKEPTTTPGTNIFDLISRFLFPITLLLFSIVYWSYYSSQIVTLDSVDFVT